MRRFLILGDILVILIITFIGFASHEEAGISFLPRMAAIFFPLCVSWFVLAFGWELFQPERTTDVKQLWRPGLAMIFAAPLAAILRGLILNAPIIPIFAVVLSTTTALGMLIWRGIFALLSRRS